MVLVPLLVLSARGSGEGLGLATRRAKRGMGWDGMGWDGQEYGAART